ncbi:MAG: PepSY domain-containing protein [Vicinamibacterales bacterium]
MTFLRKWLILIHRYLGIALSLLFVVWFASGIVMMYAGGMPRLTPELRRDRLPALDVSGVRISPADAAERAELGSSPERVGLLSVMGRPAYRFPGVATVFADTGELFDEVGEIEARTVASRFMNLPDNQVRYVRTLTRPDQWTLTQGRRQMPLHKFAVSDTAGTELYVSAPLGEVTVMTTRRGRALAWIGTIPHWLYFAPLRLNQPLWYRIVVWAAGLGCVLAVMGLILGVTQFRWSRPIRRSSIPYSGWMRWHYVTGVVFGVFTLTWVFSGLLSMEPFAWTNARGLEVRSDLFTGGPLDLTKFPKMDPATWTNLLDGRVIKEVELLKIQDEPYYVVRHAPAGALDEKRPERLHQPYYVIGRAEPDRLLVAAKTLEIRRDPFTVDSLMARLRTAVPDAPIADSQLLTEYDSYYYSRGRQTPLPVLRVKFNDPAQTWFYIDPEMSQLLAQVPRLARVERWLYNGLHSLDFSFWYQKRPLWDMGMILLSLGGLASSGIGLYLGVKRLGRGARTVRRAGAWEGDGPVDTGVTGAHTPALQVSTVQRPHS